MNKIVPVLSLFLLSLIAQMPVKAQGSVTSAHGYTVNIVVIPRTIVPTGSSCVNGYNYNVRLDYSVTFTGTNQPSSLNTLQGTLGCGANTHFFDLPNGQSAGSVISQSNVWRGISDCATATVGTLSCNTVTVEIQGPGISHRYLTFTVSNSPLPVKLTSFNAVPVSGKVKISWSTVTESNSDRFIVEKSVDGNTWSTVNTVRAAGNSNSTVNYETIDATPFQGVSQYRLKQIDIDGKTDFSPISIVKFNSTGISTISVFPVPNSGNTVSFSGLTDPTHTQMIVQNMSGATIHTSTLKSSSTELPPLKPGMYIIRLNNTITGEAANLRYIRI